MDKQKVGKLSATKNFLSKINKKTPQGLKDGLMSIIFGIILGSIFISISGHNPFKVLYIISTSWTKASFMIGDLIAIMSFYIIAGSAAIVASKAGLFNIGIGAQMMIGGMAAYMVAINTDMAKSLSIIVSVLLAGFVGMFIALFIALLKIFFRIHEVLSSIMINWIAFYIYKWTFNSATKPWVQESLEGIMIKPQDSLRVNWLSNLFPNSQINLGVFIAITTIIIIFVIFKFTVFGRSLKVIGLNEKAAIFAGINVKMIIIKAMLFSGLLAGISGVVFFMGLNQNIPLYKDGLPGQYFNAIAVAMLGSNHPIGILLSSFIFSLIYSSQDTLAIIGVSFEISQLLLSVIMYSIVFSTIVKKYHLIKFVKKKIVEYQDRKKLIKRHNLGGGN